MDQKRKSSVPNAPSTLATQTSINEAHTIDDSTDDVSTEAATKTPERRSHRGSEVIDSDAAEIKQVEDENKITEEDEEDEDDESDPEDEPLAATKPSATDKKGDHSSKDEKAAEAD